MLCMTCQNRRAYWLCNYVMFAAQIVIFETLNDIVACDIVGQIEQCTFWEFRKNFGAHIDLYISKINGSKMTFYRYCVGCDYIVTVLL